MGFSVLPICLWQAVVMVFISCMGFYINPQSTPARVTLAIITIVIVTNNLSHLTNALPPGKPSACICLMLGANHLSGRRLRGPSRRVSPCAAAARGMRPVHCNGTAARAARQSTPRYFSQ